MSKRTHDLIYLQENRYEQPKEIFVKGAAIAQRVDMLAARKRVVDIGCAAGEFLYYLDKHHPGPEYLGIDNLPELLEKARSFVPRVEFRQGSVLEPDLLQPGSMDSILMFGVHSIFDDLRSVLRNLLGWIKEGGKILMFGTFNPHPVDVWTVYRLSESSDPEREAGWNQFSLRSVERWVRELAPQAECCFERFELSFDDPPKPDDVMRTWTFRHSEGQQAFTNGASLIINRYHLLIET